VVKGHLLSLASSAGPGWAKLDACYTRWKMLKSVGAEWYSNGESQHVIAIVCGNKCRSLPYCLLQGAWEEWVGSIS